MTGRERQLEAAGWNVHLTEYGHDDDPLVILLHGFPDSPASWRHLVPDLVASGRRVAVPWMPGYGPSQALAPSANVHPRTLAEVIVALREGLGGDERTVLVGHDWGAIAVNEVTASRPELFARAVTLAVTPVDAADLVRSTRPDLRQLRLSWYAIFFQIPGSWRVIRSGNGGLLSRLWRQWSPGHEPGPPDRQGWRDAFARDGGRAAIGYYRALARGLATGSWPVGAEQKPKVPTLHLGGNDDGCYLPSRQAAALSMLPAGSQVRMLDGVGHFLHLEDPEVVNDHILAWLTQN